MSYVNVDEKKKSLVYRSWTKLLRYHRPSAHSAIRLFLYKQRNLSADQSITQQSCLICVYVCMFSVEQKKE